MQIENIKNLDVYSEEFQMIFETVLTKFVKEYDDMAQMAVIKQAKELLDTINDN